MSRRERTCSKQEKEKGVKRKDSFLKLCVHSLFEKDDV